MKKRFATLAVAALIVFTFLFAQGPVQKVRLWDTNLSHSLLLKWNEDRAAGYTLNWIGITADRTITLQGNPTLDDWFDQDYHIIATPTFAGLYLESSTAAPFLKMTNESNTERDPIIQFSVGATPVIKWTMGVDDSDDDRWKLAVGDEFGSDHDTIVVTSGYGVGPPVAEFTLIDSYPTPMGAGSTENPWGVCSDGTYLYYSEGGSDYSEYIFRLVKIDPIAEIEVCRSAAEGQGGPPWWNGYQFRQCATDGTHVYVGAAELGVIRKYLCSDLSYDSETAWLGQHDFTMCYWNGYLYVSGAYTYATNYVWKIRCSDMSVIWVVGFPIGSGVGEMNHVQGIATDGTNICIGDFSVGGNNRLVRLDMTGAWVDATVVANTMGLTNKALWYAGNYLYNYATYTGVDKIEKRNKADLSIAETFLSLTASMAIQGCQSGDYHYIAERNDNRVSKYQYTSGGATIPAAIQFRLKDAGGVFHDIAKLTPEVRFGVGTTSPTETIEAVGNIKANLGQFISTKATGASPMVVSSTTLNTNFNSDLWDGYQFADYLNQPVKTTSAPSFDHLHLTVAIGTAPLEVTSTTVVANLNASLLEGNAAAAFEPALGNPDVDGKVLSSTILGVRSWIAAGGALALDDLTDVNAAAPDDNDVLTWDAGTSTWIAAPGGEALALDDLTDVDAAAPSDDDIIRFDTASGLWKHEALPAAANHDLLSATHTDTTAASPVAGDILYADATPKWTKLAKGDNDDILTLKSGLPSWEAPSGGGGTHSLWFADAFPGSPTSQSDHFDDASINVKWVAFQASANWSATEADTFLKITDINGTGGDNWRGYYQTLLAGDFTITMKVASLFNYTQYEGFGLCLFEDADGNPDTSDIINIWVVGRASAGPDTVGFIASRWSGWNTWNAHYFTGNYQGILAGCYMRIRRSGTTLYYEFSNNGMGWVLLYSQEQPFAPEQFGFCINNHTASHTFTTWIDWIYYLGSNDQSPPGALIIF